MSERVRWLRTALKKKKLKLDNMCDLGAPDIHLKKILSSDDKKSASDTIIAFGTLKKVPVVIKISFSFVDGKQRLEDNSLLTERILYRRFVPEVLQYTPHVMRYLGDYYCFTFKSRVDQAAMKLAGNNPRGVLMDNLRAEIYNIDAKYNKERAYMLLTERAGGIQLHEWLRQAQDTEKFAAFLTQVISQLAWTFMVFERLGFSHNDIHTGNVFVEELADSVYLNYELADGSEVTLETKYFVRVFDFDRSSKASTPASVWSLENTLLSAGGFCKEFGQCNNYIRNRDWFHVLSFMREELIRRGVRGTVISALIPYELKVKTMDTKSKNRTGQLTWTGHPCLCDDSRCSTCTTAVDLLNQMVSPNEFLRKSLLPRDPDDGDNNEPAYRLPKT